MNLYLHEAMDIHHIFPKAWCDREKIEPQTYISIINKTPLTARTNRVIGGRAPSKYLPLLASNAKVDIDTVAKHISTHPTDAGLMAEDDFDAFFTARARALLDQISFAMGKAIDDFDVTDITEADITEEADDADEI